MYAAQIEAYRAAQKETLSGREIEALALTNAALKLRKCQVDWDSEDRDGKRLKALQINQRIWTILQGELAKEDNPLPTQLKKDLLTLSLVVDKRTFEVMAFPSPEKLDMLIRINLNIAAGLRGNPVE
ncbi:flagellar biosynthesis regulator FlaF [Syntrophus buswellii]|uniref:flagellar biosynthesis regulator FlaF n=1 Tax=Syntrophus buswellii TaxID=43774 RepID=UPI0009CCB529|nr:MAG: flagellar biosynthesis regulatory protein FlaF [Syntrophus sp. PtaB.Bin138]